VGIPGGCARRRQRAGRRQDKWRRRSPSRRRQGRKSKGGESPREGKGLRNRGRRGTSGPERGAAEPRAVYEPSSSDGANLPLKLEDPEPRLIRARDV
jgi:hypothetical protein